MLWGILRSHIIIFYFSSKHSRPRSILSTRSIKGGHSPPLSGLWQLCPSSQFQELWPPQNHKALGTVVLLQSQRNSHSLKHTVHRAELRCARNLASSKPQDLQSILSSMSSSRACPVFKKVVSMGQKKPWPRAWGPNEKKVTSEPFLHSVFVHRVPYRVSTHLMIWELPTRMWCASRWHRGSKNLRLLTLGQLWNRGSLPAAHRPVAPHGRRNSKDVTTGGQHIMCGWR